MDAYLIATSFEHCKQYLDESSIDLTKLPEATVFAVLPEGNYMLASIKPPELIAECYLYSRGDVVHAKVQQIYEIIQTTATAWCEI